MVPSLPLQSCESSVSVKENPDRKKIHAIKYGRNIWPQEVYYTLIHEY